MFLVLMHVQCQPGRTWTIELCREIAPLTHEIRLLKEERNAVILAHSYVTPEVVYGVADFKSDSYALSLEAREAKADIIVFAGVIFMAETAKILAPSSTVLIPDTGSGCSLADSLTARDLRKLKSAHPEAAVVCYINSSAEVKAESDVCVTSSNVYTIIERLPQRKILFVPDRLMAENIRKDLRRRGVAKEVVSSDGTCVVHEQFSTELIETERQRYPGLKVVSHPECTTDVTDHSDFVGSTGSMMKFVHDTAAEYFMILSECGLVSRLEAENANKSFIGSCRLCPFMKLNDLRKICDVLKSPRPEQIVEIPERIRARAKRSIDRMFELTH